MKEDGSPEVHPEQSKPSERRNPSTPEKLFTAHYGEKREEGSLIRPAGDVGKFNPLTSNDGIVGQLFGISRKVEDASTRAGAGGEEEDSQMSARVVHALEGIRKATEGDKKGNPGTRSAIGSEESLDVYLARGCNTLTVEVCPDVAGKELFDALKRACSHAKAKLQQIGWPCLVTNGIAYGLAAMQHGGKDHATLKVGGDPVAGDGELEGGEPGGDDDRVSRGRDRGGDKGDKDKKKREKEKDEKKAYPAGKRLRPREAAESVR